MPGQDLFLAVLLGAALAALHNLRDHVCQAGAECQTRRLADAQTGARVQDLMQMTGFEV